MKSPEALGEFIAQSMGYKYCVLFPRARDALRAFCEQGYGYLPLPTNICPEARAAVYRPKLVPVDPETGLAPVPVQLYGYRVMYPALGPAKGLGVPSPLDLDPLMTGWYDKPFTTSSIVSLGRHKTINVGGGAFLTQDQSLAKEMSGFGYFPSGLLGAVSRALGTLAYTVERRFHRIAVWDRYLGDCCTRIPCEQVMPWRVMRRIPGNCPDNGLEIISKRDAAVVALRDAGIAVGTNYQPLPGVTDPGAIQWGNEVINFLLEGPDNEVDYEDYVVRAAEIIKTITR